MQLHKMNVLTAELQTQLPSMSVKPFCIFSHDISRNGSQKCTCNYISLEMLCYFARTQARCHCCIGAGRYLSVRGGGGAHHYFGLYAVQEWGTLRRRFACFSCPNEQETSARVNELQTMRPLNLNYVNDFLRYTLARSRTR